MYYHMKRLCIR